MLFQIVEGLKVDLTHILANARNINIFARNVNMRLWMTDRRKKALIFSLEKRRTTMTEEVGLRVADDVNPVEQSSLQASDGEALISSLLKKRTMMAEEEEICLAVEIEPVEQSWLHIPDVSSLTEVGLLELEAKVELWISSRCANQNVASNAQNSSTLNVDDEAPLRDPTKRQRRCQGNKRRRGSLEKKKAPCKKNGSKAMTSTATPLRE